VCYVGPVLQGNCDSRLCMPLLSQGFIHGFREMSTSVKLFDFCPFYSHNIKEVKLSLLQVVEAYYCEMLRIPHCLDNGLKDGGKLVSLTHWPRSIPQKHYFPSSVRG
jgi:hypothetical protein